MAKYNLTCESEIQADKVQPKKATHNKEKLAGGPWVQYLVCLDLLLLNVISLLNSPDTFLLVNSTFGMFISEKLLHVWKVRLTMFEITLTCGSRQIFDLNI